MKLEIELAVISNSDGVGYTYVKRHEEGGGVWLSLMGNETDQEKVPYPLTFESEKEIDDFADKLKQILNGS